ncbi:hypothetical protein [Calycomorphotria hydatis]|uniref:Uncharacterized protein n=1 Tax=Calycomorphotria hydatis TaxID=2528027 RepID=A0A517TBE9_9PLAN|nr:hypothetical protein [Calycomorphotria hydatis]QDT65699.1 hypothetical protein V22_29590 [Calycomorphotria hydatis]
MSSLIANWLFADGAIQVAISIAVLVIGFIGWVMQMANQNKQVQGGQPRRQQRPQAGNDKLRDEIEVFLQEVTGNQQQEQKPRKRTPRRRRVQQPEQQEEFAIEVVEEPPKPVKRRRKQSDDKELTDWDRRQQKRRKKLEAQLEKRHLQEKKLGSELSDHVQEYMAEKNQSDTDSYSSSSISRDRENLTGNIVREQVAQTGSAAAVVALLKSPQGIRNAVAISEILARPRALRK